MVRRFQTQRTLIPILLVHCVVGCIPCLLSMSPAMFDQSINSSVTVKTIFIITPKRLHVPVCLPRMDTQLLHVVECLFAVWGQPAIELPVTPVAVLYADMLVPTGSIVEFLWTEWTWCLFMSSNVNLKGSCCTTVHATFTTYETFMCTSFRTCLCWLFWMFGDHVLLEWLLFVVRTVTLMTYKVVFLAMWKQIPECVKYSTGAKYTIIKYSWMEGFNMFHP